MKYRTICADPPWRYRKDGKDTRGVAHSRHYAEDQYLTMTNAAIQALPVEALAEDDAHLYLWVTLPRLYGERNDRSISPADIMEAWGFRYVTALVWEKLGAPGMGSYYRIDTELVLFGVRGSCPIPAALRRRNIIRAPRRAHSQKPEAFYDMVEAVSPGPRLEMFSRNHHRMGWSVMGDEADGRDITEALNEHANTASLGAHAA